MVRGGFDSGPHFSHFPGEWVGVDSSKPLPIFNRNIGTTAALENPENSNSTPRRPARATSDSEHRSLRLGGDVCEKSPWQSYQTVLSEFAN